MNTLTHESNVFGGVLRHAFRWIGRTARTAALNYAAAREIEARRLAFRGLDEHALRDIGVDRFGTPYRDIAMPPAANDDQDTRRAA